MIRPLFSLTNRLYLNLTNGWKDTYKGQFFLSRIKKEKNNTVTLTNVASKRNSFKITGEKNKLISKNNLIENTKLVINGVNNTCILQDGIKLRNADIIIRGTGNVVEIGKGTTFGGVRIVNVGQKNLIQIGEDCLFSDHIEIWASDTHNIFNENSEIINKEKPVIIGNDVWVGSRVIILKGIEINDGAIIGMGTIVSRNIKAKTISVGIPNKVIKENVSWTNEYQI